MSSCSGFRKETSVIWALISDGKHALIFKYRKVEIIISVSDIRKKTACNERRRFALTNLLQTLENNVGDNHKSNNEQSLLRNCDVCPERKVIRVFFGSKNEIFNHFIQTIVTRLNQAHDVREFDYLVIVAPRDISGALKNSVSDKVDCTLGHMPEGYDYDKRGAIFVLKKDAETNFNPDAA